ncbi:MAG TPA: L-seryl-tRNA(Sec) selenium transferase [Anaerolineales bacterium]|nr:L-seryl-tRNA(Sec) selenium transferase [Anaerolineales bacterium]
MNDLRSIPAVDQLLQEQSALDWVETFGRPLTLQAIRDILDEVRTEYSVGSPVPEREILLERVQTRLAGWTTPTLRGVINASGVILHTNLGRAPLSPSALKAIEEISDGYSNLEYDLDRGRRGSRTIHAEAFLRQITGAEAALVVNNNAAAVLLALTALARRRNVIIARSQLVEIGGGFRVPDVMKQSGARLTEVGTTNRVHLSDYEQALAEHRAALIMRAHRSNFQIVGFTSEPTLDEIAGVAHRANIPVVDDLGSGSLLDTARYGLGHEPMVQESLSAGADLVCFSGDKLLGGPQAGILVGRRDLVDKLKKHALTRAIRADKLCLAALSATLLHYLKDEAEQEVPIWRMISTPLRRIHERADRWRKMLGAGEVVAGQSTVGGGSLPGETLATFLLSLNVSSVNRSLTQLRHADIPVIGRAQEDRLLLDPRTVLPEQDGQLLETLKAIVKGE